MTPEEYLEYWVAPFIQEIFNEVINQERPDIVSITKKCSKMQLG